VRQNTRARALRAGMKRIATAIVVSAAAAAALAAPGSASAADTTTYQDLECEKQLVQAIPGFVVRTAAYTVEHGEPPFIGGPFYTC
jgi:NADH:ubiquinone oxidoreductase subunit H